MTKKKEDDMQTQTSAPMPRLPQAPKGEKKIPLQAEVNAELHAAVMREIKKLNIFKRQAFEYGLVAFLQATNPTAAAPFVKKLENKW